MIELANYILTRNPKKLFQMTDLVLNPNEVKQIHSFFISSLACLIFHLDSTVTSLVFQISIASVVRYNLICHHVDSLLSVFVGSTMTVDPIRPYCFLSWLPTIMPVMTNHTRTRLFYFFFGENRLLRPQNLLGYFFFLWNVN